MASDASVAAATSAAAADALPLWASIPLDDCRMIVCPCSYRARQVAMFSAMGSQEL